MNYTDFKHLEIYDDYLKFYGNEKNLIDSKFKEFIYEILELIYLSDQIRKNVEDILAKDLYEDVHEYPEISNRDEETLIEFEINMDNVLRGLYKAAKLYIDLNFAGRLLYGVDIIEILLAEEIRIAFPKVYGAMPEHKLVLDYNHSFIRIESFIRMFDNRLYLMAPYRKGEFKRNIISIGMIDNSADFLSLPFEYMLIDKIEYLYSNNITLEDFLEGK